ncbi:hypothetical protein ROZALSC1DRAFT_26048, partial [Rozella allomycis CSF55]
LFNKLSNLNLLIIILGSFIPHPRKLPKIIPILNKFQSSFQSLINIHLNLICANSHSSKPLHFHSNILNSSFTFNSASNNHIFIQKLSNTSIVNNFGFDSEDLAISSLYETGYILADLVNFNFNKFSTCEKHDISLHELDNATKKFYRLINDLLKYLPCSHSHFISMLNKLKVLEWS